MVRIPGHPPPFDVSPIVLVNTIGGAGAMNKPGNPRYSRVNLRGARAPRRRLGRGRRVAEASVSQTSTVVDLRCLRACWKELSVVSKAEIATYPMRSLLRLCSATSPGGVAKRASSPTIRDRRSSISFPLLTISCKCVRQGSILGGES